MPAERAVFAVFCADANSHFTERVDPFRDRVNSVFQQSIRRGNNHIDRTESSVHWPRTNARLYRFISIWRDDANGSGRHAERATRDLHSTQPVQFNRPLQLIDKKRFQIRVGDVLFAIGHILEARRPTLPRRRSIDSQDRADAL